MIDLTKTAPEIVEELILKFAKFDDTYWKDATACVKIAVELALQVCERCPYVYDPAPNPTRTKLSECLDILNKEIE